MANQDNRPQPSGQPTSGNTPGMTADNPQSDYARRNYILPPDTTGQPLQGAADVPATRPAQPSAQSEQ